LRAEGSQLVSAKNGVWLSVSFLRHIHKDKSLKPTHVDTQDAMRERKKTRKMQTLEIYLHCTISNWDLRRIKSSEQQGKQRKYNAALRRFRVSKLPWKSNKHYVLSFRLRSLIYSSCKAHGVLYIAICCLSGCTTFFHSISRIHDFREKKLLNTGVLISP